MTFSETKITLARLESTMKDVAERTTIVEQQMADTHQRVSDTEDQQHRHERAIRYLLKREAKVSAKCEDLKSRARRNNLRVYGIREGEEKNDMIGFVTTMIHTALNLPADLDLGVERAHRSLTTKPKETEPPRSIIVRFWDYRVKDRILQEAWKSNGVVYRDKKVFFDQDYTAEVQKKRKEVREVIKQLKEKKVKAVSPFPAKLKIYTSTGVNMFYTLSEAAPTLKQMGIHVTADERENLREKMLRNTWITRAKKGREGALSTVDLQ
uniref:L1 transposable element RRM domain-containing protein n=1 Tax=Oryzias melastigma TaxID=30732 RepID=A0A3B3CK51_ORYME